jgi:hypothetical protein
MGEDAAVKTKTQVRNGRVSVELLFSTTPELALHLQLQAFDGTLTRIVTHFVDINALTDLRHVLV